MSVLPSLISTKDHVATVQPKNRGYRVEQKGTSGDPWEALACMDQDTSKENSSKDQGSSKGELQCMPVHVVDLQINKDDDSNYYSQVQKLLGEQNVEIQIQEPKDDNDYYQME